MKTYWLKSKESRAPIPRINNTKSIESEVEIKSENKEFIPDTGRVVVYSPITFQDVARRSIVSSPIKSFGRGNFHEKLKNTSLPFRYSIRELAHL